MASAEEKIEKAIDWIMTDRVWYSLIVDDWKIQEFEQNLLMEMFGMNTTAATDGPNLYFNRKFIEDLSQDDVNTLIEHEAGHVFLSHHFRLFKEGDKVEVTPAKNVAADLALNWFIREDFDPSGSLRKIVCMPGDPKKDEVTALDFSQLPTGKDAEWYYENMPKQMKDSLDQNSMKNMAKTLKEMLDNARKGKGTAIGGILPHPSMNGSKADQEKAKQKWENQVVGGILMAEGEEPKDGKADPRRPGGLPPGKLPGNVKEVADKLIPKDTGPDWTHILRRFHHKNTRVRFSYARPNRRSSYRNDMVLPARFARESSAGLFLVDTSGSMSIEEMNRALRETEKVLVAYPGSEIILRQADTALQKTEQKFTRWDFPIRVPQTWSGRGGTELAGPIAEAARSGRFNWMVVVTDMEWSYGITKDPGIPTIWLQTKGLRADVPFGYPVDMSK